MWLVVPYLINGINLWAVENNNQYIMKYCSEREDAQKTVDLANGDMCEWCETKNMHTNCVMCGAPVCCKTCCEAEYHKRMNEN